MSSQDSPALDRAAQFLMTVHDAAPGITENVLNCGKTTTGCSSYQMLADAAGLRENMSVADLACGSGALTQLISQRVGPSGRVVGIDLNHAELALAAARCRECANVGFLEESAAGLSLPDASMDAVLCHMAIMLFRPIEPPLAEIARILRSSGTFAAVIPGVSDGNALFDAVRKTLAAIVLQEVPPEKRIAVGVPEFGSVRGIRELFSRTEKFDDDLQFTNFTVIFQETPETLAKLLVPFFYSSYLLSEAGREKVREAWAGLFRQAPGDRAGNAAFQLPLTAFTVRRCGAKTNMKSGKASC